MTNRERPKSALLERMGSSATFAWQLCAVAEGSFRNIQARTRVSELEKKAQYPGADLLRLILREHTLLLGTVLGTNEDFSSDITFRLDTVLSKEFQGESR
ncbi:hypothetical protein [Nostoc sp. 'Peltigera membranacea cyanobiont' N6]|uniref:hypothetical protein n=1 Tax=Nostoc sp. 'Peltigera membranacea cyanobiont' N6 TaxID=1261031 RepID=UPI000CF33A26|nr:hypothetical protein [Nostoc sp. 'Peltigera membranacea cyanobiont' N6]